MRCWRQRLSPFPDKLEKAQDHLKTLERKVNTEKAFSKLKDKLINDAQLKIQKVSPEAVEKFKKSNKYSNKLCDYYVDGFELFHKYMAKHHPDLDFSALDMEPVEKETLADRPSHSAAVDNVDGGVEGTVVTAEAPMGLSS